MFGFLKDKLKQAVKKLSKDVDEQAKEEIAKHPAKAEAIDFAGKKEAVGEEPLPIEEAELPKETAPTDILYEEEEPAGLAEEEARPGRPAKEQVEVDAGALEKVEREEEKEEEQKAIRVIESFEEETESKGFFGRIRGAFSKKEEPGEGEEKAVEREVREVLDEGLSGEEKIFIGEQAKEGGEEEPVVQKEEATKPLAVPDEEQEEKRGFFTKLTKAVTTKTLTENQFDEIFWDLEVALLEANVAVEVIAKIKDDLKTSLVEKRLPRSNIEKMITATLSRSMKDLFDVKSIDILERIKVKKPYVIAFFGVNGAGKTTTIAKIAHYLKKNGKSVVLAAGDTFRAAAIQQLEEHAGKLGVKIIKHDYGADSAAVGFDTIKYAESKGIDAVLIDTAGRQHSNANLMDELAKIIRVCKPDLNLFVGESITGNDCIEQAKRFDEAVGIDGIILTKADVDEKGGAAVSVSYVTKKPILFLGMGQSYDDLKPFEKSIVLGSLGLAQAS